MGVRGGGEVVGAVGKNTLLAIDVPIPHPNPCFIESHTPCGGEA